MQNPIEILLISGLWAVCAAGICAYCVHVANQITYVTLSDGRRSERRLPFAFRLLLPFVPGLEAWFQGPRWTRTRERAGRQLTAAGFEDLMRPTEFIGLRLLYPLVFGSLWVAALTLLGAATPSPVLRQLSLSLSVIAVLGCILYPSLWLRRTIADRHRSIRRSLPFLLDILTLSVEAGLDFMTALQRNVEKASLDALCEELIRVIRAIQLGKTRREALRDMSRRVDFGDLRSVINSLVQADELGVSIGTILRIQADQIRQRRFDRAERLANIAPVKMLFPLLFFIFPAVFLILLGPVLRQMSLQIF